jgi:hypothetical protein
MKLTKIYFALAILASIIGGSAVETAKADPYKWCAITGGGDDGGTISCYFFTFEQCQASVSGVGGFCASISGTTAGWRVRARRSSAKNRAARLIRASLKTIFRRRRQRLTKTYFALAILTGSSRFGRQTARPIPTSGAHSIARAAAAVRRTAGSSPFSNARRPCQGSAGFAR